MNHIILRRAVFSPRNSVCAVTNMTTLAKDCWWTDGSGRTLRLHVWRRSDNTWHLVSPRPIAGYVCTRIAVQDGCVDWLYDSEKENI